MWFSVVCTLIDNEYASSQWSKFVVDSRGAATFDLLSLLYKHTYDDVIDYSPKNSDHFPEISEDLPKFVRRPDERFRTFSEHFPKITEDFRGLPKIAEEEPIIFRSYSKTSGYFLRDYVAKAMVIMKSSRVKMSCYLHVLRYEVFAGKLTWYFTGVYIIK